ncbi:MAG: energy transducer TonB [Vulcanimicrobiaceae bacterium]|jgi:TonB family protein
MIKKVTPAMPEIAIREGASGTVQIKVELDETGRLVAASVVSSSHNAALDEAALGAAQHSTYAATILNCKPVSGAYLFVVTFRNAAGAPVGGSYLQICAPLNNLSGDLLAERAAQIQYMGAVPTISDDKKQTTGLEERFAVAVMLASDLMVSDPVIPYNGCRAIVAASPILKQIPDVRDEISRAMKPPDLDTTLNAAFEQQYSAAINKTPANKVAVATLGMTPRIFVIYRDRFSPLYGYDEIGVVRIENGPVRGYAPYSRKFGQVALGVGGQVCVQGDTRCAPSDPMLP